MNATERTAATTRSEQESAPGRRPAPLAANPAALPGIALTTPGDAAEREADRAAAWATARPGEPFPVAVAAANVVARQCSCAAGQPCEVCVARAAERTAAPAADLAPRIAAARGAGSPLAPEVRARFEPMFGRDLGQVRVHTGANAGGLARELGASAFTSGRDIWFGEGRFAPSAPAGRALLAHELTHTVQQGQAEHSAVVARDLELPEGIVVGANTIREEVDAIIEALRGPTTGADSDRILRALTRYGAATAEIYAGVRARAGERAGLFGLESHPASGDGMIEWIRSDTTSEDWRMIRTYAFEHRAMNHVERFAAREILWVVGSAFTTEEEARSIEQILGFFGGSSLDRVLLQLEVHRHTPQHDTALWLFGQDWNVVRGVDRVTARRLADWLVEASPRGFQYAASHHAEAIRSLLAGVTGTSDSSAVLARFTRLSPALAARVMERLGEWAPRGVTAAGWLMAELQADDYAELRALPALAGIEWPEREAPGLLEQAATWIDYGSRVAEVWACVNASILAAPLMFGWDLLVMVWDLGTAIRHLAGLAMYGLTDGAIGRGSMQAFRRFWAGLEHLADDPIGSFDAWWDDLVESFDTIEGPLSDCRRAWFVASRVISAVINIALTVIGGYGALKGAATVARGGMGLVGGLRGAAGAEVAAELAQAGMRTVSSAGVALLRAGAAGLAAVRHPIATLRAVGVALVEVIAATDSQAVFSALRRAVVGEIPTSAAAERAFWLEHRAFWRSRAWAGEAEHQALLARLRRVGVRSTEAASAEAERVVDEVRPAADALGTDTVALHDEVVGATEAAIRGEPDALEALGPLDPETRAVLDRDPPVRQALLEHPDAAAILWSPDPPAYPRNLTPDEVSRLDDLLAHVPDGDVVNEAPLADWLAEHRDRMDEALDALERALRGTGPEDVVVPDGPLFTEAEIDQALAGMGEGGAESPRVTGRSRPRIDDTAVPRHPRDERSPQVDLDGRAVGPDRGSRRSVDLEDIPLTPEEQALPANTRRRAALARIHRLVGHTLDEIPELATLWERAADPRRALLVDQASARGVFDSTRDAFWRLVRRDPAARARFTDAGYVFAGDSGAPRLAGVDPAIPVREHTVSLDHQTEIRTDWNRALDADNLEMMFAAPNTEREIFQMRHGTP